MTKSCLTQVAKETYEKKLVKRNFQIFVKNFSASPLLPFPLSVVFGMLPMMIYPGTGTEFYRPLAVAVIFGLAFATALTLVLVPVVVWIFERDSKKKQRKRRGQTG
ncbi:MAG: efflux RND transporter permease subunit [candidate division KSB1 bacterium]|nr:efflux RND transporter permease subunit [candidate division KSB1 bacterium]MDZ7368225.1 efflux RND transporter permease subunit [candidate division KSB1 bacterium]